METDEKKAQKRFDVEEASLIEGKNAAIEALHNGRLIDKVYFLSGDTDRTLNRIVTDAKKNGAILIPCDKKRLDKMSETGAHQGIILSAAAHEYTTVETILKKAEENNEAPLVIVCDEIVDPHNLGAIIRSAHCAGAHGVIIPKRRNVGLTATVGKAAAGALEYLPVARVANISQTLELLKKKGLWVCGAAAEGSSMLYQTDLTVPTAIVIGAEGTGISRLVREHCDYLLSIPMYGTITSLNASASAAIILYEAVRQRHYGEIK